MIDSSEFILFLANNGYEVRRYSGRGMGGRSCVGVEINHPQALLRLGVDIGGEFGSKAAYSLMVAQDGFASAAVVYFANVAWTNSVVPEGDD